MDSAGRQTSPSESGLAGCQAVSCQGLSHLVDTVPSAWVAPSLAPLVAAPFAVVDGVQTAPRGALPPPNGVHPLNMQPAMAPLLWPAQVPQPMRHPLMTVHSDVVLVTPLVASCAHRPPPVPSNVYASPGDMSASLPSVAGPIVLGTTSGGFPPWSEIAPRRPPAPAQAVPGHVPGSREETLALLFAEHRRLMAEMQALCDLPPPDVHEEAAMFTMWESCVSQVFSLSLRRENGTQVRRPQVKLGHCRGCGMAKKKHRKGWGPNAPRMWRPWLQAHSDVASPVSCCCTWPGVFTPSARGPTAGAECHVSCTPFSSPPAWNARGSGARSCKAFRQRKCSQPHDHVPTPQPGGKQKFSIEHLGEPRGSPWNRLKSASRQTPGALNSATYCGQVPHTGVETLGVRHHGSPADPPPATAGGHLDQWTESKFSSS